MNNTIIKVTHLSKEYILGQISSTTLRDALQRRRAKILGKEDPTQKIGSKIKENTSFKALDDISFEVEKGERVGIIGHNGAGKSTLLKLISRITAPSNGEICLNGKVASMLEVGTGFNGELTGRENIYMNGAILGMTKKEIDSKLEKIIDFSECRQFIDTPVKRYSSGMYVKLAFSVAAHLDSEIVIMDEVLAVGDMAFQKKCIDKMNQISKNDNRTILYVSHNMNTIQQLCNRVIVLSKGKIEYDGSVEKGIDFYFNHVSSSAIVQYYNNYTRPTWLSNQIVEIDKSELLNKTNNIYSDDEKMLLNISWQNLENVDNLSFRFEIHKVDGSAVSSAILYEFYSGKKKESSSSTFEIDLSNIVQGYYTSYFVMTSFDESGNECIADFVPGIDFEVVSKKIPILWNSACWGNTSIDIKECKSY